MYEKMILLPGCEKPPQKTSIKKKELYSTGIDRKMGL
jgi:hypothetical protein